MNTRAAATTVITLTAVLALAGCAGATTGSDRTSAPASPSTAVVADANTADVMFTTMMIPHHKQAVEMADMILAKKDVDNRVVTLAGQIKAAQDPEITTMSGWLQKWGAASTPGMGGMDHGDGMMTDTDMTDLDAATGADASRLFLKQMIQHHQGAITMAQTEIDNGQNTDATALAQQIVDAQKAEITTMRDILATL